MLLSRENILALYDSPGRETLQLLADSPESPGDSIDGETQQLVEAAERLPSDNQGTHSGGRKASKRGRSPRQSRILAGYDPLTGLSNRADLQGQFGRALAEAARIGSKIAFVVMDLDNFKDLNNTLGHKVGDEVLLKISERVQSLMRPLDAIGRFGGDEFGFILKDLTSEEEIKPITNKLLEAASAVILTHTPLLQSGASAGAALFPDHGAEVDELIQNAEIALYQAKADGRGQARVFNVQMRVALIERLEQLSGFRSALETGKLRPYYQPQMRLSDRRSYGFEALARWILPNGDILYPGQFQIAMNDPDAAILLGEHMLQSISDDLRQWQDAGMPTCKVSVNVTGPELKRGDYPQKVADNFHRKGIPLSQLTVEVTESVLLDDKSTQVAQALSDLRQLGVSIALDDFGTGFASLTHLKSHPIDQIKIDKSFIAELPFNAGDRAIVRATLNLARNLRIETIAEGVENEVQLKYLQSLGCDYAQGYFFSPAVPAIEAEAYFRRFRAYRKAQLYQFIIPPPALPF